MIDRGIQQISQFVQSRSGAWQNHARLLDIHMPDGSIMLVESMEGVESMLGMPIPVQAEHLLPDPDDYPAALLHGMETSRQQRHALFSGYRYQINVLAQDVHLDTANWMNGAVCLTVQTDQSAQPRYIHGLITNAASMGSNGGFARYQLTVEPWTAYLRLSRFSRLYLRQHVADILSQICQPILDQGVGQLYIHPEVYQTAVPFIQVTQFQETDWHFMQRLLQESGLSGWFEHQADQHILHIAPAEQLLSQQLGGMQRTARYHRQSSVEQQDSVQQVYGWQQQLTAQAQSHLYDLRHPEGQSWQSHSADSGQQNIQHQRLSAVRWSSPDAYQRMVNIWQAGQYQQSRLYELQTTLRAVSCMDQLTLLEHPRHLTEQPFKVLSVYQQARNNLAVEMQGQQSGYMTEIDPATLMPVNNPVAPIDFYQNQMITLPVDEQMRHQPLASYQGLNGQHWLGRPVAFPQTAIVVGVADQPHDTDRNHRLKIQFHWQRGQQAQQNNQIEHARLNDNAPGDEQSSLWVTVLTGSSGDHMGNVLLPRKGQEVLVQFVDDDIDQPIIVASQYNGEGIAEQNGNQTMAAASHVTSNASAWSNTQQYADVLRGFKSQSMQASQQGTSKKASGTSGYNQFTFDLSPQSSRIELSSTSYRSQLQQGHIKHQQDLMIKENRGVGYALETEAAGNIRAEQGLLLSSHTNNIGQYMQVHSLGQLQQAVQHIEQWQQQATTHQAVGVSGNKQQQSDAKPQQQDSEHSQTLHSEAAQQIQDSLQGVTIGAEKSEHTNSADDSSDNGLLSKAPSLLNSSIGQNVSDTMSKGLDGLMGGVTGGLQKLTTQAAGWGINKLSHSLTDQLGDKLGDVLRDLQDKYGDQLSPELNAQLKELLHKSTDLDQLSSHLTQFMPDQSLQQRIMGQFKSYLGNNVASGISRQLNQMAAQPIQQLTDGLFGHKHPAGEQKQPAASTQTPFANQGGTSSAAYTYTPATSSEQGSGWNDASIVIEAPGMTTLVTPQHLSIVSAGQTTLQSDTLDLLSQSSLHHLASANAELFAQKDLRITAANGRMRVTAHNGQLRLDARQDANFASRADLIVQAPDTIKLVAGGSGIEISGGNITFSSSGKVKMLAAQKIHEGGGGDNSQPVNLKEFNCEFRSGEASAKGTPALKLG